MEILIKKISSKLKVFHLSIRFMDINYFDCDLWERLILQYFPHLEKFYLNYSETTYNENQLGDYLGELDQFISSFWIEREWIFEVYS
jgi:hypothetical protein